MWSFFIDEFLNVQKISEKNEQFYSLMKALNKIK